MLNSLMFKTIAEHLFFRSWWVIAFILICAILYEQGLKGRETSFQQLKEQQASLFLEKQKSLERQQYFEQQINSQSDLAWLELTLMKGLGLVPENDQKVFFYRDRSEYLEKV